MQLNRAPAEIGKSVLDVDAPALLVELDALESNLQRMAGFEVAKRFPCPSC
jgi:hypothetical protein